MTDDALFDLAAAGATPERAQMGEDARRTQRQLAALAAGRHPVSRLPLHPDAPPVDDRQAPGPRCRSCAHVFRHRRSAEWFKCGEHATGGPATDIRLWWPACRAWRPRDES